MGGHEKLSFQVSPATKAIDHGHMVHRDPIGRFKTKRQFKFQSWPSVFRDTKLAVVLTLNFNSIEETCQP